MRLLFYHFQFFLLFHCISSYGQAQYFDQSFMFIDGIYLNFEQLTRNDPSIPMTTLIRSYINNTTVNRRILGVLPNAKADSKTDRIEMSDIWAICINGVPMKLISMRMLVQTSPNAIVPTEPIYFLTRFSMIGNLTYYQIPKDRKYWPTTINYVIKYNEATVSKLNKKSIIPFIKDDAELFEKYKKEPKKKKNILVYLSEYNRRNPVLIKEQ